MHSLKDIEESYFQQNYLIPFSKPVKTENFCPQFIPYLGAANMSTGKNPKSGIISLLIIHFYGLKHFQFQVIYHQMW